MPWYGSLVGGRREGGPSVGAWRTPAHVKTLYLLMHRHIRIVEDIDRRDGGVYSPTLRDDAQDARSRLLSLLVDVPGEATYRAIQELAVEPPDEGGRFYMRRRA